MAYKNIPKNNNYKKEEKLPSREELDKYSEWYVPSKDEALLMKRILFEISEYLKKQKICNNGKIKWCSNNAITKIPYGLMAKVEYFSETIKPFSIPVVIENIDKDNEKVTFSFKLSKNINIILEHQRLSHGYIDNNERLSVPCLAKNLSISEIRKIEEKEIEQGDSPTSYKKNLYNKKSDNQDDTSNIPDLLDLLIF